MSTDRILLTGSSGLIGTSVVRFLRRKRISIVTLHRSSPPGGGDTEVWDPYAANPVSRPEALAGITAAVHLSGANLAGRRWTSSYKREIFASRITPTHTLATLLAGLQPKPAVLVCASAVGIYGGRGDEVLTEALCRELDLYPSYVWHGKRRPSRPPKPGSGSCTSALGWCFRAKGVPWRRCCPSSAPDWAVGSGPAGSGLAGFCFPMRLG